MKFTLNPVLIHREWPNGGWKYRQPETRWSVPSPMADDFNATVGRIIRHRSANPALGLATDVPTVSADLQHYTALRLFSEAPTQVQKWVVPGDDEAAQKKTVSQPVPSVLRQAGAALAGVVNRIRRSAKGAKVLLEWLGSGGTPVSPQKAVLRAAVCMTCPKNGPGGSLESAIAEAVREHESVRGEMQLRTPHDARIDTCGVCGCYLKLKVWVPLAKAKADTEGLEFPAHCWIRTERDGGGGGPGITIQRMAAFGDVLVASVIADAVAAKGFEVSMICNAAVSGALANHPRIRVLNGGRPDVNLDATYELNHDIGRRHIYDLMWDAAVTQLRRHNIDIGRPVNCLPTVVITPEEREVAEAKMLADNPRIVVIPASTAWPNRTVAEQIWRDTARLLAGKATLFWAGIKRSYPPLVDLRCGSFREVMAAISCADLVLTVDTGPMHVAAALRKPIVAIQQAFRIDLRLTDHTDWTSVGPALACLGCCKYYCPIDKAKPPCANVPAAAIADAVIHRFQIFDTNMVAAVIPVYRPNIPRLNRCVAAIAGQVDEIVVALDGDIGLDYRHPKVRIIPNPSAIRTGYGRTVMRGARHTSSGWLLVLNDDCYLDPGAVEKMRSVATDKTAVVGCLLRYPDGTIQHGGVFRAQGSASWGHVDHRKREPSITAPREMDGVTFAAALVRRKAFYSVGGFDDRFDCYCEDSDFCMSVRQAGWKVMYQPLATGIHEESQTSITVNRNQMLTASSLLLARKWDAVLKAA